MNGRVYVNVNITFLPGILYPPQGMFNFRIKTSQRRYDAFVLNKEL